MFKKDNRYVTREVNEEVDIRLQLMIWSMLDKLKDEGNVELDYLQIFKIRKDGNKIVINQSQEVPEYSCTYEIELEDGRTVKCNLEHLWPVTYESEGIIHKEVVSTRFMFEHPEIGFNILEYDS